MKISDLASIRAAKHICSKTYEKTGVPVINPDCIENERINMKKCRYTRLRDEIKGSLISRGDIILARRGEVRGLTVTYREEKQALANDAFIIIRALDKTINLGDILKKNKAGISTLAQSSEKTGISIKELKSLELI